MAATSVGQIGLDLVVNQNQFNKQMTGIQSLAKKTGKILASAFAVKKLVDFGKQCVELGSDLQEVQNVVDVTFPKMSSQVDDFAKTASASFGLSETMAKKFTGTFGSMAKAFGFSEEQAYAMGTTLTGLAGDVASFYNITQDEAYTKLKSVFSGETETLKDLGVVMTQTALDAYALANGYGKTTKSMSEAEKVALRYAFVQNQLSAAAGDFARTSDSWANQTRILSLQFDSLKASIRQGLINLLTPVIKVINTIIGKLSVLAASFKSFTELITGKKSSDTQLSAAVTNADALTDSVSGIGKAAKKSAKEMKGLSGIDELNNLSSSSSETSLGGGSASIGNADLGLSGVSTELNETEAKIGEFAQKITGYFKQFEEAAEPARKSLENLKKSFEPLSENIGEGVLWFIDNILAPLTKWVISEVVPRFFDTLSIAIDAFNAILEALKPLGQWLFDELLKPIAEWTADLFLSAWDLINEALSSFADWCEKNPGTIQAITVTVGAFFAAWKGIELLSFIQQSGGVITALKGITSAIYGATAAKLVDKAETIYLNALYAKDFVVSIGSSIAALVKQAAQFAITTGAKIADAVATASMTVATAAWNVCCTVATAVTTAFGAAVAFLTSPIGLVILAITALIAVGVLLWKNWDTISAKAKEIWEKIEETFKKFDDFLQGVFQKDWSECFGEFGDILNGFMANASNIWESIKGVFNGVVTFVKGVFSGDWKKAWEGVKQIFKGVFDGLVAVAKAPINIIIGILNSMISGIVSGINVAINALNKLKLKVPDWIPLIGGKEFKFNIKALTAKKIPYLAQGGYVRANTPQLAMIGDNRHQGEIVSPEDKLEQMALRAAQMASKNNDSEALRQMILLLKQQNELLMQILAKETGITEKELFNSVRKSAELYKDSTGKPAFSY